MFCHLNYYPNKKILRDYFFKNEDASIVHEGIDKLGKNYVFPFWKKLYHNTTEVKNIINDLGLTSMNVSPRFSFQEKNTLLPKHIDIDRIVGINFNLLEPGQATIHMNDIKYSYESALIDVGSQPHSVKPVNHDRLVLKLAIREPWDDIYEQLDKRNLIKTKLTSYSSQIAKHHMKYVESGNGKVSNSYRL